MPWSDESCVKAPLRTATSTVASGTALFSTVITSRPLSSRVRWMKRASEESWAPTEPGAPARAARVGATKRHRRARHDPMDTNLGCAEASPLAEHLQRHLYAPERGAHLHPLDAALDLLEHLAGDFHALRERRFFPFVLRAAHAVEHFGRHHDAGHLVGEELRVAQADERPDARHDRDAIGLHALQEALELAHVEHRLCDCELRAGVHFP